MIIGELLGVGNTAAVYRWGETQVVKLFHHHPAASHEAKIAEIVSGVNVRAPRYGGLIEYEGKSGILYEKIDGPTMLRQIEPTQRSVSHNARLMAQLQYDIHCAPIKLKSNLKAELTKKIEASPDISSQEKQAVQDALQPLPEGYALCHYDFHPDNIILSPSGPVVIDWMNLLVGDPAADVARSFMMIRSSAVPPFAPAWLQNREYRRFFYVEYLEEYVMLSGLDTAALEKWMLPTLAARIEEMEGDYRKEIIDCLRARLRGF